MSTNIGRLAESAAADFLISKGYRILNRNWRDRFCEIDIVCQKNQVVYFVEVKYRSSDSWGAGLAYITPSKLKQMHLAAQNWLMQEGSNNSDWRLAAIEVSGIKFEVTSFLSEL